MINFDGDRITGWANIHKNELMKLQKIEQDNLLDRFNQPNWTWPDYPEGEPVYSPQPYTLEQTEQIRKEKVRAEVRQEYDLETELKILRESIAKVSAGEKLPAEFTTYNQKVEQIITESKIKTIKEL